MADVSLHASLAASAVVLFASDPYRRWKRGAGRPRSRGAVCLPIAVACALTALSGIAAVEYPLSLTDVLNQF